MLSLLLLPVVDVIIMVLCLICKTNMPDMHLHYHLMKCDLISKTGGRLVDMIITYIRSNGDYDTDGADFSKMLPMLQASGWTIDQLTEVLEALAEDKYIKVSHCEHHYKFNYWLNELAISSFFQQ